MVCIDEVGGVLGLVFVIVSRCVDFFEHRRRKTGHMMTMRPVGLNISIAF